MHKFDRQLVAVIDRDIIPADAPTLFNDQVCLGKNDSFEAIPGALEILFGNSPSYLSWRCAFEKTIRQPLDTETIRSLTTDRIRLSLLLDSPGGVAMVYKYYEKLVELVKKNGGTVDAYVGPRAHSAAQILLCLADERFCLDRSQMMMHLASLDMTLMEGHSDKGHLRRDVERRKSKGYEDNIARIMALVSPLKRGALRTKLNSAAIDDGNDDDSVYLFGREMEELGIATRSFEEVEGMRQLFRERTGINLDGLGPQHSINRFFKSSRMRGSSPGFRLIS